MKVAMIHRTSHAAEGRFMTVSGGLSVEIPAITWKSRYVVMVSRLMEHAAFRPAGTHSIIQPPSHVAWENRKTGFAGGSVVESVMI